MPGADLAVSEGTEETGGQSRMYQNMRLFPAGAECAYFFRIQKGGRSGEVVPLLYRMEIVQNGKTILEYKNIGKAAEGDRILATVTERMKDTRLAERQAPPPRAETCRA
jgi:hypothetical protein